ASRAAHDGTACSDASRFLEAVGARAATVRTVAGQVDAVELSPELAGLGVEVARAVDLASPPRGLGAVLAPRRDAFTDLADGFGRDAVVCTVPDGVRVDHPIVVVHEVGEHADGAVVLPRTLLSLGSGARASVVELLLSGPGRALVVPIVELDVGDGAELAFTSVQLLGRATWQVACHASRLGRDAVLRSFVAALGGDYARQLTQSELGGAGCSSELLAVYLGDGTQVQDFRTFQEHVAPRTRSELVFKGAVSGTARSVYTGLIHMHAGAKRADASQTNRNLVLSEGAHADSVPNLDIEENDVRCSHASAVGPIDEEQLFYLASRGVPPDVAERLVLLGFFEDLLARAPEAGVASYLRGAVADRIASAAALDEPAREAS
ncbi:MAG: Fe-S cluster assembly protein SufD, partial [Actinomycetota bacterium]|nr:Fe-S cluster assembly protein SufD [Actinomycetota bacterium]